MKITTVLRDGLVMLAVLLAGQGGAAAEDGAGQIARGRYLVATSGCNDCHTPGYPQAGGNLPMQQWLIGSPVGFQGPWGTSYPANLRLTMSELTEPQWLQRARSPMRPPMPWFNLRDMTDEDLRAIYAFVRSLQPLGEAAPAYAPPGQAVNTPYFDFVPRNLPVTAQLAR